MFKMSQKRPRKPPNVDRRESRSNDDNSCTVCHEAIEIFAIGHCDHPICYKCSTRMRALCDQMYCAICRADIPKVLFVKGLKKFDSFKLDSFCIWRERGIFFEDETIKSDCDKLLENKCKLCKEGPSFTNFKELEKHMGRNHQRFYCELCVTNLTLFSCDRKSYDREKLAQHKRQGDSNDTSYRLHPLCKFCDKRYFDNDELLRHLRKDHYYCHFCETDGISNEYFQEYSFLRDHFREKHFLCEDGECAQAEFVNAFRSDIDLKAHISIMHSSNLGRQQTRQLRAIDIDINFGPRPNAGGRRNENRHRGGASGSGFEGRGGGRYRHERSDHRRLEEQEKRLENDTALALTLSLADAQRQGTISLMDAQLVQQTGLLQPNQNSAAEKPEFKAMTDADFPLLHGQRQKAAKQSDKNGEKDAELQKAAAASSTLAQVLALKTGHSVSSGQLNEQEFPSLVSDKPRDGQNRNNIWTKSTTQKTSKTNKFEEFGVRKSAEFGVSAKPGAGGHRGSGSGISVGFHKSATSPDLSDFPALGNSSNGMPGSATWVNKKANNTSSEQPVVKAEKEGLLKLEMKAKGKNKKEKQLVNSASNTSHSKVDQNDDVNKSDKRMTKEPVKSLADIATKLAGDYKSSHGNPEKHPVEDVHSVTHDISKKVKSKKDETPKTQKDSTKVTTETVSYKENAEPKSGRHDNTSNSIHISDRSSSGGNSNNTGNILGKNDVENGSKVTSYQKAKQEKSHMNEFAKVNDNNVKKKKKAKSAGSSKDTEQTKENPVESKLAQNDCSSMEFEHKSVNKTNIDQSNSAKKLRVEAPEFMMAVSDFAADNSSHVTANSNSEKAGAIGSVAVDGKELNDELDYATHMDGGRLCDHADKDNIPIFTATDFPDLPPASSLSLSSYLSSQLLSKPSDFPEIETGSTLAAKTIDNRLLFTTPTVWNTGAISDQEMQSNWFSTTSDIPSFLIPSSSVPPPPGFSSASTKPPPGFSSKVNKPPPGFYNPLPTEPDSTGVA